MSRAFVCDDETAVAEYRRVEAGLKQWRADFIDACRELGSEGGYASVTREGIYVSGLQRCDPAPAGWRWTPTRKCMRPIQGADGAPAREWLKTWSGHKSGDAWLSKKFGMPTYSHSQPSSDGTSWLHRSRARVVEDRLFVLCDYDKIDGYDKRLWREIKVSEYHAALEAAGAPAEG